jgi:hypothetical protein
MNARLRSIRLGIFEATVLEMISLADEAAEAAPAQCRRWSIAIHSLRP